MFNIHNYIICSKPIALKQSLIASANLYESLGYEKRLGSRAKAALIVLQNYIVEVINLFNLPGQLSLS